MRSLSLGMLRAACLLTLAGCVPHSLESTEVGVRTIRVALVGSTGVVSEAYPAGQTYF